MLRKNRFFTFVILFSLFMGAAFASSALLITSKLIEHKQLQQKALIQQLITSRLTEDAKTLSRQLRASVDFEFLTISDVNNNVLYRYIKDHKQRPTLSFVLKYFDLYTPVQRLKSSQGKLVIEFQSSFSQVLLPLTLITVMALFAPIMMTLLIYLIAEFVQDKRLEKVIYVLEQKLLVNPNYTPTKYVNKLQKFQSLLDKIEEKRKENQVVNEEPLAKVDRITGLPSGPEFIHFYRNKVKFSGHFILVRAIDLNALNLSHGYKEADKYLQLIAKAIWQTFSFASDCHIYKINESDFGIIIFDQDLALDRLTTEMTNTVQSLSKDESYRIRINTAVTSFKPSTTIEHLLTTADKKLSFPN